LNELQVFRGDEKSLLTLTSNQIDEKIDIMKNTIAYLENRKKTLNNCENGIINIE
jgi:hypothetical protein